MEIGLSFQLNHKLLIQVTDKNLIPEFHNHFPLIFISILLFTNSNFKF